MFYFVLSITVIILLWIFRPALKSITSQDDDRIAPSESSENESPEKMPSEIRDQEYEHVDGKSREEEREAENDKHEIIKMEFKENAREFANEILPTESNNKYCINDESAEEKGDTKQDETMNAETVDETELGNGVDRESDKAAEAHYPEERREQMTAFKNAIEQLEIESGTLNSGEHPQDQDHNEESDKGNSESSYGRVNFEVVEIPEGLKIGSEADPAEAGLLMKERHESSKIKEQNMSTNERVVEAYEEKTENRKVNTFLVTKNYVNNEMTTETESSLEGETSLNCSEKVVTSKELDGNGTYSALNIDRKYRENVASESNQNLETEVTSETDESGTVTTTTRIKKVTSVSFSKQELRSQKVEFRSSRQFSGDLQDLWQKSAVSEDPLGLNVAKAHEFGRPWAEKVYFRSTEEEESESTGDESQLKKVPIGGVCMFGGEELLAKIKKRRIEIDAFESNDRNGLEKSNNGGTEHEHTKLKMTQSQFEIDASPKHQPQENQLTEAQKVTPDQSQPESRITHNGESLSEKMQQTTELQSGDQTDIEMRLSSVDLSKQCSAPSLQPRELNSVTVEVVPNEELDMDVPCSDAESLSHLNKDRPKGPSKRKPSFNSQRSEQQRQPHQRDCQKQQSDSQEQQHDR